MNIAIIFAGGSGQRLNSDKEALPKQFIEVNKKPILIHTLEHFNNHPEIDEIYIAIIPTYRDYTLKLVENYKLNKVISVIDGGSSAMESIKLALIEAKKKNKDDDIVLIHDGVRPVITSKVISDNIASVKERGSAVTVIPSTETIIISKNSKTTFNAPKRKELYKAQAPQSFYLGDILKAHEKAKNYDDIVDCATLLHTQGKKTHLVQGNFGNIKVTTLEDLYILKGILEFINEKG